MNYLVFEARILREALSCLVPHWVVAFDALLEEGYFEVKKCWIKSFNNGLQGYLEIGDKESTHIGHKIQIDLSYVYGNYYISYFEMIVNKKEFVTFHWNPLGEAVVTS